MCMYFESKSSLQSLKLCGSSLWRFFRCSASLKFSSKKQKCPSESHHGIVWAVCLSAYAMLECFYGQPQPSLVLLEIGWTTFPFCWCPHLFLLLKTTFHLSPFLTLGQVWLKKKKKNSKDRQFKSRSIPTTEQRALSTMYWNILWTGQEAAESSGTPWKNWSNWSSYCLPFSFLPFRSESLCYFYLSIEICSNILKILS